MHQRSVALCIVLTIITCGIYGLYWMVCLTDDSTEVTGMGRTSGGMALVFTLITCTLYLPYWAYKMGEKLDASRAQRGLPSGNLSIVYLVLSLLGVVFTIAGFAWLHILMFALIQSELNKYTYNGNDF